MFSGSWGCWVWSSCGGGWWALAAGGVRAVASGSNKSRDELCRICIIFVGALEQAGRSGRGAWVLAWVRIRTNRYERFV